MWMQIAMLPVFLIGIAFGFTGGRALKRQAILIERPLRLDADDLPLQGRQDS